MKFRLSPIAAAMLAAHALPAAAQSATAAPAAEEPAKEQATQLREVKVEADIPSGYKADTVQSPKFTQPLRDTPQTIQVITSELFTQQGATTLTEALRNTPAVGTFYAGENGNTSTGDAIYMRGFDTSSSLFVDGIRDLGSISRDLFNIEQVEVVKGPAGTDTGRSAPTGAINLVSKQAFLDNATSGVVSFGSDGQQRVTADLNQTLAGLPGAALRLNVLWDDSDVPGRDHVHNSRSGIAPSLGFGLNGSTRAYVNLLYVKQDNIPDGFVPTIGLPGWQPQYGLEGLAGHPVDPENFYGTRQDHDDVTAKMATVRIEHDFSDKLKLSNIARWGETVQDYLLTSFMGTGGYLTTNGSSTACLATGAPAAGYDYALDSGGNKQQCGNIRWTDQDDLSSYTLSRSNPTFKDQRNKILTDQLNLRYDFTTGRIEHALSTGVELTRDELHTHTPFATSGSRPAANLYDPDWNDAGDYAWSRNGSGADSRTDTYSVYAFDTVKFGEHFLVTAGLRADHYKTEYESRAICNDGSGRGAVPCNGEPVGTLVQTNDLDADDTLFNWKLGVVYKPVEAGSLYANYAISQQPPGGSNLSLSSSTSSLDNPDRDPQKTRTYELGTKWSLLDEMLALNLALFRTEVNKEINSEVLVNGLPTQTGEKRVQGVELSVIGNITENWAISAGYAHLNTSVEKGSGVTSDGSDNLAYTPSDALTTWTTYRLPLGFTVGGGVRYSSRMHRGTDGAVGTPAYTQSYTVYDAVASYDVNEHFTLRVNGYNLFDKEYVAAINKSGYRYLPGTPRTFLFSGEFRF